MFREIKLELYRELVGKYTLNDALVCAGIFYLRGFETKIESIDDSLYRKSILTDTADENILRLKEHLDENGVEKGIKFISDKKLIGCSKITFLEAATCPGELDKVLEYVEGLNKEGVVKIRQLGLKAVYKLLNKGIVNCQIEADSLETLHDTQRTIHSYLFDNYRNKIMHIGSDNSLLTFKDAHEILAET